MNNHRVYVSRRCCLWIVLIAVFLCVQAAVHPIGALAKAYVLGEGDVLTISVYEHPDLRTTARISGDGMITLPLIGPVRASDLSISQLVKKIETLLADGYIVNPQVNIFMEEFRSRKVTILGEVKSSGVYEIKGSTTFLELISQAGGLTQNAADAAFIHRQNDGEAGDAAPIVVDLKQLMEQGQSSQNIHIVDGDNIYIPKKEVFYLSGQVNRPGAYNYEEGLTVIQALAMAGDANDKAAPDRISIIRTREGKEHLIKDIRMDMLIQPNDVIVVPESYF